MENIQQTNSIKGSLRRIISGLHGWGVAHPLVYYTLPLAIWVLLITYGSLAPPRMLPETHASDKILHAGIYSVLGWLLLRAWLRGGAPTGRAILLCGGIIAAWGFYLECLQALTPDRSFELLDEFADIAGAAVGLALWLRWRRLFERLIGPAAELEKEPA